MGTITKLQSGVVAATPGNTVIAPAEEKSSKKALIDSRIQPSIQSVIAAFDALDALGSSKQASIQQAIAEVKNASPDGIIQTIQDLWKKRMESIPAEKRSDPSYTKQWTSILQSYQKALRDLKKSASFPIYPPQHLHSLYTGENWMIFSARKLQKAADSINPFLKQYGYELEFSSRLLCRLFGLESYETAKSCIETTWKTAALNLTSQQKAQIDGESLQWGIEALKNIEPLERSVYSSGKNHHLDGLYSYINYHMDLLTLAFQLLLENKPTLEDRQDIFTATVKLEKNFLKYIYFYLSHKKSDEQLPNTMQKEKMQLILEMRIILGVAVKNQPFLQAFDLATKEIYTTLADNKSTALMLTKKQSQNPDCAFLIRCLLLDILHSKGMYNGDGGAPNQKLCSKIFEGAVIKGTRKTVSERKMVENLLLSPTNILVKIRKEKKNAQTFIAFLHVIRAMQGLQKSLESNKFSDRNIQNYLKENARLQMQEKTRLHEKVQTLAAEFARIYSVGVLPFPIKQDEKVATKKEEFVQAVKGCKQEIEDALEISLYEILDYTAHSPTPISTLQLYWDIATSITKEQYVKCKAHVKTAETAYRKALQQNTVEEREEIDTWIKNVKVPLYALDLILHLGSIMLPISSLINPSKARPKKGNRRGKKHHRKTQSTTRSAPEGKTHLTAQEKYQAVQHWLERIWDIKNAPNNQLSRLTKLIKSWNAYEDRSIQKYVQMLQK